MNRVSGQYQCVDTFVDDYDGNVLFRLHDREWAVRGDCRVWTFTQAQFDAVDFSPRVGMQFDMTWEFRPTGRRSGGGQQGTIHITAISNVTEEGMAHTTMPLRHAYTAPETTNGTTPLEGRRYELERRSAQRERDDERRRIIEADRREYRAWERQERE